VESGEGLGLGLGLVEGKVLGLGLRLVESGEGLGLGLGLVDPGLGEPVEFGEGLGLPQPVPNTLHLYNHSTVHTITKIAKPTALIIVAEGILVIDL